METTDRPESTVNGYIELIHRERLKKMINNPFATARMRSANKLRKQGFSETDRRVIRWHQK
jgi:hypothetical protein